MTVALVAKKLPKRITASTFKNDGGKFDIILSSFEAKLSRYWFNFIG